MDGVQWSYGVLLWELLTRGAKPYEDVEITRMRRHLKDGYRLAKPSSSTPDFVYAYHFLACRILLRHFATTTWLLPRDALCKVYADVRLSVYPSVCYTLVVYSG